MSSKLKPHRTVTQRDGWAVSLQASFRASIAASEVSLVDLKTERGKEIVRKLIERSDVLVENYGPGTLDRFGFGADAVEEMNPRIIYCALKGFLQGPYESAPRSMKSCSI